LGVAGSVDDILAGHANALLLRVGEYASIVSVELRVVWNAFLRFSNSGYGTNLHGTLSWSQLSGWK
jgi:hypothetical protein